MRTTWLLGIAALAVAFQAPAQGKANPETLREAVVAEVVDGDTVALANGTEVRLMGIQAPKLPLGRLGFKAWPLAQEAKAALAGLTRGHTVSLRYEEVPVDRHGRLLAHLYDESGRWIQGEMVALGLARVYTFRDNRDRGADLLKLERAARSARKGIWNNPYYRIIDVAETPRFIDTFQLVEGTVRDVAVVRGRAYLNFGPDYRTDFTVSIAPRDVRLFRKAGHPPESFEGRRIRVRGWLETRNGPMIDATHPEQIELLNQ